MLELINWHQISFIVKNLYITQIIKLLIEVLLKNKEMIEIIEK